LVGDSHTYSIDYYKFVPKGFHIIGFDGAGTVLEVGPECTNLKPGDDIFFVSSTTRQGSAAEYVLVDERLCAEKPKSLDFVEAASMGLTFGTAYQSLVDRLEVKQNENVGILIVSSIHSLSQCYKSYCYSIAFRRHI
jgi:NADPH:quinone reductase-like Zn-dependent oxidoreductase